jgi:hypothetical protein
MLATVLDMSINYGQQTALYTNSVSARDGKEVFVPPANGRTQREELFAAMAEMRFIRTRSFHMLLREAAEDKRGYDILVMTRYMTKEIDIEIDSLRQMGNKVEALIIPDPLSESHALEGGDSGG